MLLKINPTSAALRKIYAAALRRAIGTITHVATQESVAALTFDDGPHPEFTRRLLEILEKHHARATFFMVGQAARRYPEIVRQVAQAGHAIGNHTWNHPSVLLINGRERRTQIRAGAQAIAPYGQRLFRPPYGHQDLFSRLDIWRLRHEVVTWSLHAYDWLDRDEVWMADWLGERLKPGDIVLLHDTLWQPTIKQAADRRPMLEAVDLLLERLQHQFHFVTVPDLLLCGVPQRNNWYRRDGLDN